MNEFTKEELEYLFRKFMLTNGDDFEHNLEAKIQSLIDNYCEHEPSEPRLVLNKKCIHCNQHLETRPWGPE